MSQIRPRSKESILNEVNALHALVRKARREVAATTDAADKDALGRRIRELESSAARLEKSAVDAKSG
ncbi:MAG: hypothetical protein JSR47_08240 [Proteobacteria bacterium]|nr:hypothetical protein [Pseudomonadota bacterium]